MIFPRCFSDFDPNVNKKYVTAIIVSMVVGQGIVKESSEVIAVKRLSETSPLSRDKAFKNEVLNIMALKHENIVKLVGYCHEAQRKVVENNGRYVVADIVESLLCYEYLPKGSVHKNLFGMTCTVLHLCFSSVLLFT